MKKIIAIVLMVFLITGCSCESKEYQQQKKYSRKSARSDQKVDGMDLKNAEIVFKDGISHFSVQVKNNTDSDYSLEEYEITFYGEDGKKLVTIPGYVGDTIKAGEFKMISSSVDMDLTKIGRIKYKVIK